MEEKKENENKKETKNIKKSVIEETEKIINNVLEKGISADNLDMLGKVVDIHKDIANERYWEEKEDYMRYSMGNYGRDSYGREDYGRNYVRRNYGEDYGRRRRDSRGRYTERGVDAKYRGEEAMDEMYQNYQDYSEGKEEYNRSGNYGAKDDSMKSLDYMMKSVVKFINMLEEDADSPEEMQLIKKYTRQISEM